ncbi:MAG: hypothetical protein HGB23_10530 [Chlorobiaceae bacterium]|nr:hypothetical protein [Chlorobiaceae bacterium]
MKNWLFAAVGVGGARHGDSAAQMLLAGKFRWVARSPKMRPAFVMVCSLWVVVRFGEDPVEL